MLFLGPVSSIFDYVTYFVMYFGFHANTDATAPLFQTGWFVESILTQTLIIHIIRTRRIPFIESRASWPLIITSILICADRHMAALLAFRTWAWFQRAAAWVFWPVVTVIIFAYLILAHVVKLWFIKRFGWN